MSLKLSSKKDYNELLLKIISPTFCYFDTKKAIIELPVYYAARYSDRVIGLETFARILWGLAYVEGNNITDKIKKIALRMIANGTNPNHSEYWGTVLDYDQRIVEMLPISFFMYRNVVFFNEELDQNEKDNIVKWLLQINQVNVSNNNWIFFVILVNEFLKALGFSYSQNKIDKAFVEMEKMYLGNGWYSDGITNQRDYYVSFAIHYYSLLYARYIENPERISIIKERSKEFSKSFIYWFSDSGAALPFGRSLTYKFAQCSFWSAYVTVNPEHFEVGYIKGIINRNLRWWMEQNIFTQEGFLTLGYAYPNQAFTETYNATGSGYWALKAFAMLLCSDDNSFFIKEELPLPKLEAYCDIPKAKMSICRFQGDVYAFVNGQFSKNKFGHTECKYEKFVYSTLFGFNISKSYNGLENLACDSNMAISFNGEDYVARHDYITVPANQMQVSIWKPIEGVKVNSSIIPGAPWHIRIHKVKTEIPIILVDCGYSIDNESKYETKNGILFVSNESKDVVIVSVFGNGEPVVNFAAPGTNALYSRSTIPCLKWELEPGQYFLVSAVYGAQKTIDTIADVIKLLPCIEFDNNNRELIVNGKRFEINVGRDYKEPYRLISLAKRIKKILRKFKNSI